MSREIKFRAWDGVKMKIPFSEMLGYIDDIGLFGKSLSSGIFEGDRNKIILMQYTGLKDKNGKEIYEGDIVEWDDESNGAYWRVAIVEIKPDLQFRIIKNTRHELSAEEGCIFHFGNFAYTNTKKYLRKIGNIYQNKDLLN